MDKQLQEVLQRVRRIETRQMVMARALGLDPKTRRRVTLRDDCLDVTGFDISMGDIVDFCRKSGITGERALLLHGQHIGYLNIDDLDRVSPPPVKVLQLAGAIKETHAP